MLVNGKMVRDQPPGMRGAQVRDHRARFIFASTFASDDRPDAGILDAPLGIPAHTLSFPSINDEFAPIHTDHVSRQPLRLGLTQ